MAAISHLMPDWLAQDLEGLVAPGKVYGSGLGEDDSVLSQTAFEEEFLSGYVDPWGTQTNAPHRYYYTYDQFRDDVGDYYDPGQKGHTKIAGKATGFGGKYYDWQDEKIEMRAAHGSGGVEGYEFTGPDARAVAYQKYLESLGFDPETQTQEEFVEGPVEFLEPIGAVNWFDKESLISSMELAQGVKPDAEGFSRNVAEFTPEMFKKLRPEYYQGDVTEGRETLLSSLYKKMRKARNVGSGLAGSGRRTREISEEKEDYLTGMGNIYSGIDTKRAGALQSIYNVIEDYQGLI